MMKFSSESCTIRAVDCKVKTQLSALLDRDSNVAGNTDLIRLNDFGTWWLLIAGMGRPP